MQFGILDIITVLLVTIGPLKALIVYATLTARADADFRRQVAIKTVRTAAIVTLVFVLAGEMLLQGGDRLVPDALIAALGARSLRAAGRPLNEDGVVECDLHAPHRNAGLDKLCYSTLIDDRCGCFG